MVSPPRAIRTYSDRRAFNCLMPTDFMRTMVVTGGHLCKCAKRLSCRRPQGYGILCLPPVATSRRFIRKFGTGSVPPRCRGPSSSRSPPPSPSKRADAPQGLQLHPSHQTPRRYSHEQTRLHYRRRWRRQRRSTAQQL
jgi:hypothetical protein